MDQRKQFIADLELGVFSMAELCRRYGVSRKTGYKWLERYQEMGTPGLADRSRKPHHSPTKTPPWVERAILEARRKHPRWGAGKLLWAVARAHPQWPLPARSTVCEILKRHGMVSPRGRRKPAHPGRPHVEAECPNDVWAVDFKGEFKTGDGIYCYPLTVTDSYSRFILGCKGLYSIAHEGVQPRLSRLFRKFGLPGVILSDNGVPFATTAIGRLSKLSVWWIHLGIRPVTIEPGKPHQNSRHERMHRTLKAETVRPPAPNLRAQQRRFDRFRTEFNEHRPHEALGQQPPETVYRPSPRPYPQRLPEIEYPAHYELRRVWASGRITWKKTPVNVSHVLEGETVGLEELDDGVWAVYFGPLDLGRLDERIMKIRDHRGRTRRKPLPMSPD